MQPSGGHHAVNMRIELQLAIESVENGQYADPYPIPSSDSSLDDAGCQGCQGVKQMTPRIKAGTVNDIAPELAAAEYRWQPSLDELDAVLQSDQERIVHPDETPSVMSLRGSSRHKQIS
jgi:hypothetical protein